jgi:protein bicaudal D
MSDDEMIETLKGEIIRLQNYLDESSNERVQAAEYGLAVLEENNKIKEKLEEIEAQYDIVKHELECAKEVCIIWFDNQA